MIIIILSVFIFGSNSNDTKPAKINTSLKEEEKAVAPKKVIQNGDLIFHTSTSNQSLAIQIASDSRYSHVGMIYQDEGKDYVLEAVERVKITSLQEFISRGEKKHYVVKRLKNSEAVLTAEGVLKMKAIGKKYLNKSYDLRFEWSDEKIYCSELVWKIYQQAFDIKIGELQQIKEFDLSDPIEKAKAQQRYGNHIPMEELIITPDRIFQSDKLLTVIEN